MMLSVGTTMMNLMLPMEGSKEVFLEQSLPTTFLQFFSPINTEHIYDLHNENTCKLSLSLQHF